ncbi:MAG: hypothetical protein HKN36_11330 [Hellea sp.]|nr:hypothetical protein [Hellea sp.]
MSAFIFSIFIAMFGWTPFGIVHDGAYTTGFAAKVAFLSDGTPVAIYNTGSGGPYGYHGDIYVKRWNGSSWDSMGNYLETGRYRDASRPDIAVDSMDNLYAVFYENIRVNRYPFIVLVKKWNGSDWENVGPALNEDMSQSALSPRIVIDGTDRPVVAFSEFSSATSSAEIFVKRWNGASWEIIGGAADDPAGSSASSVSLVINHLNRPVIAYQQDYKIKSARWNGAQWIPNGGVINVDINADAYAPNLAKGSSGKIFIAWHEQDAARGGPVVHSAEWRGNGGWFKLGGPINDDQGVMRSTSGSIDVRGRAVPTISWKDFNSDDLYVSYFSRPTGRWITYSGRPVGEMFGSLSATYFANTKVHLIYTNVAKELLFLTRN